MTFITNENELQNWDGTGVAILQNNITLTGTIASPIKIDNEGVFDGNKCTITLHSTNTFGLFIPKTDDVVFKIKNLFVNASELDTTNKNCGVILGSTKSVNGYTVELTDCASVGEFNIGINGGGIIGSGEQKGSHNIIITGCYSTGNINSSGSGGVCGGLVGFEGVLKITNCYSTGSITGDNSGGIVGTGCGYSSTNITITNCYSTGLINGECSGGICGSSFGLMAQKVKLVNCYSSGEIISGSGMLGSNIGKNITLKHCYSRGSSGLTSGNKGFWLGEIEPTIRYCNHGNNQDWDVVFDLEECHSLLSNRTWVPGGKFQSGFGLNYFRLGNWDSDSYLKANESAEFTHNCGVALPCMKSLDGNTYDLITERYFRLFDNTDENDRFIINAQMSKFTFPNWRKRKYIKTIFVKYGEDSCIINTGFMGRKSTVIKNEGNIFIEDEDLPVNNKSKRYCTECTYSNVDDVRCDRHFEQFGHDVPLRERNSLKLSIPTKGNTYYLTVTNVDENNMEPCKTIFTMEKGNSSKINNYRGAIVQTVRANTCDVYDLYDDSLL